MTSRTEIDGGLLNLMNRREVLGSLAASSVLAIAFSIVLPHAWRTR